MFILYLLTIRALSNEINNVTLHPTPPKMLLWVTVHLGCTGMYRISETTSLCKNSVDQIINTGHTYPSLNSQNTFLIGCCFFSLSSQHFISDSDQFLIIKLFSLNLVKKGRSCLHTGQNPPFSSTSSLIKSLARV